MKRELKIVDENKWYHIETLKKHFSDSVMEIQKQANEKGMVLNFISFRKGWFSRMFVEHPKHKRLRWLSKHALREIGFED